MKLLGYVIDVDVSRMCACVFHFSHVFVALWFSKEVIFISRAVPGMLTRL